MQCSFDSVTRVLITVTKQALQTKFVQMQGLLDSPTMSIGVISILKTLSWIAQVSWATWEDHILLQALWTQPTSRVVRGLNQGGVSRGNDKAKEPTRSLFKSPRTICCFLCAENSHCYFWSGRHTVFMCPVTTAPATQTLMIVIVVSWNNQPPETAEQQYFLLSWHIDSTPQSSSKCQTAITHQDAFTVTQWCLSKASAMVCEFVLVTYLPQTCPLIKNVFILI